MKILDKMLSGGHFLDLYSNCNSNFREVQLAINRGDKQSEIYWLTRIAEKTEVRNKLFLLFAKYEDRIIKGKNTIEAFERFCIIQFNKCNETKYRDFAMGTHLNN